VALQVRGKPEVLHREFGGEERGGHVVVAVLDLDEEPGLVIMAWARSAPTLGAPGKKPPVDGAARSDRGLPLPIHSRAPPLVLK